MKHQKLSRKDRICHWQKFDLWPHRKSDNRGRVISCIALTITKYCVAWSLVSLQRRPIGRLKTPFYWGHGRILAAHRAPTGRQEQWRFKGMIILLVLKYSWPFSEFWNEMMVPHRHNSVLRNRAVRPEAWGVISATMTIGFSDQKLEVLRCSLEISCADARKWMAIDDHQSQIRNLRLKKPQLLGHRTSHW